MSHTSTCDRCGSIIENGYHTKAECDAAAGNVTVNPELVRRTVELLDKLLDPEHCLTFETRDEGHAFFKMETIEEGRALLAEWKEIKP